jgi:pyruvate formate lyase activating enzyme
MRKAQFAESLARGVVACRACPRECILADGQTGLCRVRHNLGGELFSSSFGRPVAMCVEPVEKKFLFHAFPGTRTLSLGAAGCNMTCGYCINGAVAQRAVDSADLEVAPEAVVRDALMHGVRCSPTPNRPLSSNTRWRSRISGAAPASR